MNIFYIGVAALRLLVTAFFILLAVRLAVEAGSRRNSALATLRKRFATGEITEEQFRRMRKTLES